MKIGFYSDLVLGDDILADSQIQKKWKQTDFNCVNLECPLYSGEKKSKKHGVCLYSKASDLSFLQKYNFKLVNLANNHMMDFGPKGLQETIEKLENSGIGYFGAGENEEQAYKPYILEDGKKKIMLAGFSWRNTGSVIVKKESAGVAGLFIKKTKEALAPYKGCDKKIAYFHFGTEFEDMPEPYLKKLAEELLEEDYLDIVIGNHPHCIQGVYRTKHCDKEKVCFYSLGNLMIPEGEYYKGNLRYPEKSRLGFGVIYDSDSNRCDVLPYRIENGGRYLRSIEASELQEKIDQYSQVLHLPYDEYRKHYKQNRNNKRRPIFQYNDHVNVFISIPFRLKLEFNYILAMIVKKLLWFMGFKIVHDEHSGGRKLVRRRA